MLRHVPLRQVAGRARLHVQRRAEESIPYLQRRVRTFDRPSSVPPLPVLPGRKGLIDVTTNQVTLHFLGRHETIPRPIDWRPEKHRQGTRLWLLHLHYMEYLEEVKDHTFLELVEEWISGNPPYGPDFWKDNWNSFSLSIRVVVWMQQLTSRGLLASVPRAVLESLSEQLHFLERHVETDIGGNHLMKNIKALLWGGRFFEGDSATRWQKRGEALLRAELRRQILPDGVHFELAPAYHRQVFADLLEMRQVVSDSALARKLDSALARMADALFLLTHPDGELAQFGDTSLRSDYPSAELLRYWSTVSGWKEPRAGAWDLSDSGFAGYREGGEYFIIRAGRLAADELPAHSHGDVGSFEWSRDGKRVIVDVGVYEYNEGARRRWSRSTEAHNTVTVDGADQGEFWGSFRLGRRPRVTRSVTLSPDRLEVAMAHDGFARLAGSPTHRRTVIFTTGDLQVVDEVTGSGGQEVVARITLHPEAVSESGDAAWHVRLGDSTLLLETAADVAFREVERFPEFGRVETASQVLLRYGTVPVAAGFRLRTP
jgi:uncharacterized heparinase superfamily protein